MTFASLNRPKFSDLSHHSAEPTFSQSLMDDATRDDFIARRRRLVNQSRQPEDRVASLLSVLSSQYLRERLDPSVPSADLMNPVIADYLGLTMNELSRILSNPEKRVRASD